MTTTSSQNYTGLYSSGTGAVTPGGAYGNANVVSLLAAGSDGANTVTSITATGNVVAANFIGNVIGNITGNIVVPGNDTEVLFNNNGNIGTSGQFVYDSTSNSLGVLGNVSAFYFIGNGSQLTGIATSSYGNANVANFLANYGSNTISSTGNVTVGNVVTAGLISATGNVTGGNVVTAGQVTAGGNITGGNFNTQGIVTAVGNVDGGNLRTNGLVSGAFVTATGNINTGSGMQATGNISGNYFLGNGALLTGIAGTYGNANVANFLANYGSNTISTSGNVTGAFFIGNGSQLTGIVSTLPSTISVSGNITGGNINTAGIVSAGANVIGGNVVTAGQVTAGGNITGGNLNTLGLITAVGNVDGGNIRTNGLLSGAAVTATGSINGQTVSASGNITGGNIFTSGQVSATGNVTAAYLLGNGSLITSVPSPSSLTQPLNVNGFPIFASPNANILLGSSGLGGTGNINMSTSSDTGTERVRIDSPLLQVLAPATFNSTVSATGNITGGNIRTVGQVSAGGNITGGNLLTAGFVSATGNSTLGNLLVNGGGVGTINTNVINAAYLYANTLGSFSTGETIGDMNVGNSLIVAGSITATGSAILCGTLSASGNVTGGNIRTVGQVSASGNITGGNVNTTGQVTATGNVTGANLNAGNTSVPGTVTMGSVVLQNNSNRLYVAQDFELNASMSAVGNITAPYFIGNGSALTGIAGTAPAGNTGEVQFNNTGAFGGNNRFTWDSIADTANIANVYIAGSQIRNTTAYATPSTSNNPGRLVIGTGYDGDITTTYDFTSRLRNAQLAVWKKNDQGNSSAQPTAITASQTTVLTANVNNSNARTYASSFILQVGGGASNFQWQNASPISLVAQNNFLVVGNVSPANVGNTVVLNCIGTSGGVTVTTGSNIGNAVAVLGAPQVQGGNYTGAAMGFATWMANAAGGNVTGEAIAYYHPSNVASYGLVATDNRFRQATNGYWFLKNEDNVAQSQMGSLRRYHEYNYANASTSGSITISKNDGQVQQISPTGNITISGYSNFVTTASNGANTWLQADTVTIIVRQGATPYTVTMPTGSTYKYSGNTSTVGSTANAVTMIAVTAVDFSGTTTYLTTISPEFV